MKKKQELAFAPIYLNKEKKRTLATHRIEKEDVDGSPVEFKVPNELTNSSHPLNRKSRRYVAALKRKA